MRREGISSARKNAIHGKKKKIILKKGARLGKREQDNGTDCLE